MHITMNLQRGVAVLAAALGGLGLVMWVAANWDTWGRLGHFALLQGWVLVTGVGAALRPKARAPLGLLALVGIGALFAYFGQTYQTGADPWQLFALWAVLALPLCLAARTDVLWAPWALVAVTCISLWTHTYSGHSWSVQSAQLTVYLVAWSASVGLAVLLGPWLARVTGAGVWSFRTAVSLSVMATGLTALGGLFFMQVQPQYPLGVLVLAVALGMLSLRVAFDVFAISATVLGLNVVLVGGLVRWMFDGGGGDTIGRLMLLGLLAAALLAASVSGILRLARWHAAQEGTP